MKNTNSDDDDDNDEELEDTVQDLQSTPNLYELPRPKDSNQTTKKYEPIDWHIAFPNTLTLNNEIPLYWTGSQGPNIYVFMEQVIPLYHLHLLPYYPKKFAFFHLIFAAMAITHPQVTIYQLIH